MNEKRENILVSACLLGINCRYDGNNGKNEMILGLMEKYNLIPVCPEQLGGLMTPRKPAERGKTSPDCSWEEVTVFDSGGKEISGEFKKGAVETLKMGRLFQCRKAVLKERSPSCGSGEIYDGTFSGNKIKGDGVTTILLKANGISVTGESGILNLMKEGKT